MIFVGKGRININRKLKEPERGQYLIFFGKFRHFRRMTQEELAFIIGVAPSYISFFEQDNSTRTRSPKLNLIRDVAYALKVCPNDMIIFTCTRCELNPICEKKYSVNYDNFFEDNINYYL